MKTLLPPAARNTHGASVPRPPSAASELRTLVRDLTRRHAEALLERYRLAPGDHHHGGLYDPVTRFADTRESIYRAQTLFAVYLSPAFDGLHAQPHLWRVLEAHLDFLRRRQRPDGSIGLGAAGVGSGNEIGFTLPGVCATFRQAQSSAVPGREQILTTLGDYLQRGAEAVRHYWPHTSNHRWTACAGPLAVVDALFPHPGNRQTIHEYLADGIDLDDQGLYHEERSPNYNTVANWGLLWLADHGYGEGLLEKVAANLHCQLQMIQPSGEAETCFSHRQDRGTAGAPWGDYYQFRRLSLEKNDGVLATAADLLRERMRQAHQPQSEFVPLWYLLDDLAPDTPGPAREPLPERFAVHFPSVPMHRLRRGPVAATLCADAGGHFFDLMQGDWGGRVRSDQLLTYHVGHAAIEGVKVTWGSGTGGMRPEALIEREPGMFQWSSTDPGWDHLAHYRPRAQWGPRRIPVEQWGEMIAQWDAASALSLHLRVGGWAEMPINLQFLLRESCQLFWRPTPEVTPQPLTLAPGGHTFSAGGRYELRSPRGGAIHLTGLPASAHHLLIGGGRRIPGDAERRCHTLVIGLMTPVDVRLRLEPE